MSRVFVRFGSAIALLALIGCSAPVTATPVPAPTVTAVPTVVPVSAPTAAPIMTSTVTATPVSTSTPSVKTTPSRTSTVPAGMMRIKLYLIAVNDNGVSGKKIGCNDSLVAVNREIPATNAPLTAALNDLFSLTGKNYGQSGLYNVLYQSKLKIDSIAIVSARATINLSGSLVLSGVCDNPRVQAEIEQVALQFSTVKTVAVFLNGKSLQQVLSEK